VVPANRLFAVAKHAALCCPVVLAMCSVNMFWGDAAFCCCSREKLASSIIHSSHCSWREQSNQGPLPLLLPLKSISKLTRTSC
jgi:hypothetical protein